MFDAYYFSGTIVCLLMAGWHFLQLKSRGSRSLAMAGAFMALAGLMQAFRLEAPLPMLVFMGALTVGLILAEGLLRRRTA